MAPIFPDDWDMWLNGLGRQLFADDIDKDAMVALADIDQVAKVDQADIDNFVPLDSF